MPSLSVNHNKRTYANIGISWSQEVHRCSHGWIFIIFFSWRTHASDLTYHALKFSSRNSNFAAQKVIFPLDIEAETKWTPFSSRHFQMHFLEWTSMNFDLFPRIHSTIFQHWFRKWLGAIQATSHYLNQWWYSLMNYICVTRPQRGYI